MNAPEKFLLPDIQALPDVRCVAISKVGVKSLVYPIRVAVRGGGEQPSIGEFDMYVGLPGDVKGTHMSRFVEVLQNNVAILDAGTMRDMTMRMLQKLDAVSGYIDLHFTYFVSKRAPVSGVESLLDYRVSFHSEVTARRDYAFRLKVTAPVTSLCPCSKEISEYGAHNQRSHITIAAELRSALDIEALLGIAEEAGSCQVYGLLKRPDEKWVTERAYDNPKFVEDLVRDIALRLDIDERIGSYSVESENFESIHNHSAYALVEREKSDGPRAP